MCSTYVLCLWNVYLCFHFTMACSWILSCAKPRTLTWQPVSDLGHDHPLAPHFPVHLYKGRGRRWSSLSPNFSFDYKNVAHLVLGAEPSCLPTCILHKHPIVINLLLTCHFASCWIPSVLRHKEPELHWVLRWVLQFQDGLGLWWYCCCRLIWLPVLLMENGVPACQGFAAAAAASVNRLWATC